MFEIINKTTLTFTHHMIYCVGNYKKTTITINKSSKIAERGQKSMLAMSTCKQKKKYHLLKL